MRATFRLNPTTEGIGGDGGSVSPAVWAISCLCANARGFGKLGDKDRFRAPGMQTAVDDLYAAPWGPYPYSLATVVRGVQLLFGVHLRHEDLTGVIPYHCQRADLVAMNWPSIEVAAHSIPPSIHTVRWALASGYMIAVGLSVGESWLDVRSVATGEVRPPRYDEWITDGDCVVIYGWDDKSKCCDVLFCNDESWGDKGRGRIHHDYVCSRIWCHEMVVIPSITYPKGNTDGPTGT